MFTSASPGLRIMYSCLLDKDVCVCVCVCVVGLGWDYKVAHKPVELGKHRQGRHTTDELCDLVWVTHLSAQLLDLWRRNITCRIWLLWRWANDAHEWSGPCHLHPGNGTANEMVKVDILTNEMKPARLSSQACWSILTTKGLLCLLPSFNFKIARYYYGLLQYFGHLMWRVHWLGKTLMLGKTEGKRRGRQKMRWLDSITCSMEVNFSKLWETVEDRGAWRAIVYGVTKKWTWLSDWTTAKDAIIHEDF